VIELQRAAAERDAAREAESRLRPRLAELEAAVIAAQQALAQQREETRAQLDLEQERRAKLDERVALMKQRLESAANEKAELAALLQQAEAARSAQVSELETLLDSLRNEQGGQGREAEKARADAKALQDKLNETESFLIKRQRDFERVETQFKSLLEEVGKVADLRTAYEKAQSDEERTEIASQIGRRLDSLFAASGRPVHADRRTEKVVILHVKKSDTEIAQQAEQPFVATNKPTVSKGAKGTRKKTDRAQ
jgi:chromosome segregation ATPase